MRIVMLPVERHQGEEEMFARLVGAIAEEIWRLCGRRGGLAWLEAERVLAELAAEARAGAADVALAPGVPPTGSGDGHGRGSCLQRGWQQPHISVGAN